MLGRSDVCVFVRVVEVTNMKAMGKAVERPLSCK